MNTILRLSNFLTIAIFLITLRSECQTVFSEVPFVLQDGVVKCKRVNVAFNRNVIPTAAGVTVVDTTEIVPYVVGSSQIFEDEARVFG